MLTTSFMEHTKNVFGPQMELQIVTEEEILNIINSLDNKSSSGCDGLSNNMVKSLKNEYLY